MATEEKDQKQGAERRTKPEARDEAGSSENQTGFGNALSEATERGYLGGSEPEERFAEEERQRRIRAGLTAE